MPSMVKDNGETIKTEEPMIEEEEELEMCIAMARSMTQRIVKPVYKWEAVHEETNRVRNHESSKEGRSYQV